MSVFRYSKYKIRIDPDSQKTQGLQAGDIVRREYVERERAVYSLMAVVETGVDMVCGKEAPYFVGALLDGDEPRNGELLDFIRLTNLFNPSRSGALYLTASDSEAPYMDVIDGMATERSLCYPTMAGGIADIPYMDKYTVVGTNLIAEYRDSDSDVARIVRLTRSGDSPNESVSGLKQTLEESVCNPERILVSFKIQASKMLDAVPVSFGYTNGDETDAEDTIAVDTQWGYHLWVINVEYPKQYSRSFLLDLAGSLIQDGDWCEIAELNIVRLSSIVAYTEATKARVGKISGIVDPVFGALNGYGVYFQNLYATRNVNIAGTLTAGDENGFASTFYVGKIHKNVIQNSLACKFCESSIIAEQSPVGIGNVVQCAGACSLTVQSSTWREAHIDVYFCFSIWIRSAGKGRIRLFQDEHFIGEIDILAIDEWRRYKTVFQIRASTCETMKVVFSTSLTLQLTAAQLEAGRTATPYQATDEVLSYIEDYGAWFNKGGIGGTIQNPLLRFNDDGSITSRDDSFVINRDGTGHFAEGRFSWTKNTISLRDITIRWEDLDEQAHEQLKPRSVSVTGGTVFHYADSLSDVSDPDSIDLIATEYNFELESRCWEYLAMDGAWKDAGNRSARFTLLPSFHGWEQRDTLTLRYTAKVGTEEYTTTHTVFKLYDGESAYSVYVESTLGTTFHNGATSTCLRAHVYSGATEITDRLMDSDFCWKRTSLDAPSDALWNSAPRYGKELTLTEEDVWRKAVFNCEVTITK